MPTNTPDQGIPLPIDADTADNPVAFVNDTAVVEPRLVRRYLTLADRTARMVSLSENDFSTLLAEDRAEIYDGANHISLYTRALFAAKFRTTDATPVNNSVALVSDSTLLVALPTAGRYQFECVLFYDSSTAADFKAAFTIPAGATMRWGGQGPSTSVASGVGTAVFTTTTVSGTAVVYGGSGVGTANAMLLVIKGAVLMGGTAGNLQLQYAQSVADPTDTIVRTHSRLLCWRVA